MAGATVFCEGTGPVPPERLMLDTSFLKRWQKSSGKTPHKRDMSLSPKKAGRSCRFCGVRIHSYNECPARQVKCHFCWRLGHFEDVCEKWNRDLNFVHLHAVSTTDCAKFVKVAVNKYVVTFKVDSS